VSPWTALYGSLKAVKDHLNSFKAIPIFLMLHKGESNNTIDNLAS